MLRSLNSGVAGMQQFQGRMDVIGNNIANSNTIAYKSARADFEDSFSQTLQASTAGTGGSGGTASVQIGSGVTTGAIKNLFTQGAISGTGVQSDLAISGAGFFVVHDTVSNNDFVTRAGDFHVDNNGYLVTNQGMRLQGYNDAALSTQGDLTIDATGAPATAAVGATVVDYNVDVQGKINVRLSDGTQFVRGQLLLQNFSDPSKLSKQGDNLYSGLSSAGPLAAASAPGTSGLGSIKAGALELSNVDLANEFANLITSQRGFQACARMITTSDEVLQELIGLKR